MGAIDTLLGLLAPPPEQQPPPGGLLGGPQMTPSAMPPMAGPQASPMPMQQAAPQPSMFDRIKERLGGLLDDAKNMGKPGDATEYGGLLSPDDIARAKPGFMARLSSITPGAPNPGQQYHANLNNMVAVHQAALGAAEAARIRNVRQSIETRFPMPPMTGDMDKDRAALQANLAQRYDAYIGAGDGEMAKEIGQSLRGIMGVPKPEVNKILPAGSSLVGPKGEILAKTDPLDKAADFTQYVDAAGNIHVLKKDENPPAGWKTIPQQTATIRIDAGNDRAQAADGRALTAREDRFSKQFDADTKDIRDRSGVVNQALLTIQSAANDPNPANRKVLYKSALANFIQAADQKAQLRAQILAYFNNLDPSIGGNWATFKDRVLKGERPAYQLSGMLTHMQNLSGLLQSEFNARRAGLVSRHPEMKGLEDVLPQASEYFPNVTGGMPAPAGTASDLYSKYGLTPKKP